MTFDDLTTGSLAQQISDANGPILNAQQRQDVGCPSCSATHILISLTHRPTPWLPSISVSLLGPTLAPSCNRSDGFSAPPLTPTTRTRRPFSTLNQLPLATQSSSPTQKTRQPPRPRPRDRLSSLATDGMPLLLSGNLSLPLSYRNYWTLPARLAFSRPLVGQFHYGISRL